MKHIRVLWRMLHRRRDTLDEVERQMLALLSKPTAASLRELGAALGRELSAERLIESCQQLGPHVEEGLSRVPAETGLHVCPKCGSKLVQLVLQEETIGLLRQRVWRRCPECEWESDATHCAAAAEAFAQESIRRAEDLRGRLEDFDRERLERMTDVFARALAEDLITADDFAR